MSRIGGYLPADVVQSWFADPMAFIASATGARSERPWRSMAVFGSAVAGRSAAVRTVTRFVGLAGLLCKGAGRQGRPVAVLLLRSRRGPRSRQLVRLRAARDRKLRFRGCGQLRARQPRPPLIDFRPTQSGIIRACRRCLRFPWTVSVVPLGIARGALDAFSARSPRSRNRGLVAATRLRDGELVEPWSAAPSLTTVCAGAAGER